MERKVCPSEQKGPLHQNKGKGETDNDSNSTIDKMIEKQEKTIKHDSNRCKGKKNN
jgi:hypothetical protein